MIEQYFKKIDLEQYVNIRKIYCIDKLHWFVLACLLHIPLVWLSSLAFPTREEEIEICSIEYSYDFFFKFSEACSYN